MNVLKIYINQILNYRFEISVFFRAKSLYLYEKTLIVSLLFVYLMRSMFSQIKFENFLLKTILMETFCFQKEYF